MTEETKGNNGIKAVIEDPNPNRKDNQPKKMALTTWDAEVIGYMFDDQEL